MTVIEYRDFSIDAAEAAWRAFDDPQGWAHWAPERRPQVLGRLADELGARPAQTTETTVPLSRINEATEAQHRGEVVQVEVVPDASPRL